MTANDAAASWLMPDWPAPANVGALVTTRRGGVSVGAYASLNLGDHVGDDPEAVAINRAHVLVRAGVPARWLQQVHGTRVIDAAERMVPQAGAAPEADAAFVRQTGVACAIMTADCLPVLFCDAAGRVAAAAHAGWRGLLAGVLEATVAAMTAGEAASPELLAWLGPAIGPQAFEVGGEVREAFMTADPGSASAFVPHGDGKWLADIYALARRRLAACGVTRVYGGNECTVSDAGRFFSYRRDGVTGRMASLVWLRSPNA